jgi:NADH-quinone oxidoreductase subunit E
VSILSEEEVARIRDLKQRYPRPKSAILPALWVLQHREGILTAEGMREVASVLDLAPGPVEAVASFYSMFFFKPHGRYLVEVCTSISCLVTGSTPVMRRFEEKLEVKAGETTPDGLATLLEVECIGACGGAPACQVNHGFVEQLTPQKVDVLVEALKAGKFAGHELPTGAEAAARETVVDLAEPGAYRLEGYP